MFIDLKVGALKQGVFPGLTDNGAAKVEYTFHNLPGRAAFNVYGWRLAAVQEQGISWTNRVTDAGSSGYSVIYAPLTEPVADFRANVTAGIAPLDVQFTDTSAGDGVTSWQWIFSDDPGTVFTEQDPVHSFASTGTYTVNHSATNAAGTGWSNVTDYITVTSELPPAPAADFSADVTSGTAPLTVQFTDASTGSPTSWSWTFGDGGSSAEQSPSHTYSSAGTYTVNLTATNAGGSDSEEKTGYISVTAPEARTWTVGASGCDFTVLDDALYNPSLNNGDTVLIYNGSYASTALVTKTITLTGEGADMVTIAPTGVSFSGAGTKVEGIRFNAGTTIAFSGADTLITHCNFTGFSTRESVIISGQTITLDDNNFQNNPERFLSVSGSGHIISNNVFEANGGLSNAATRFDGCSNVIITRNTFTNNTPPAIGLRCTTGNNSIYLNNFIGNSALYQFPTTPAPLPAAWNTASSDTRTGGMPFSGPLGNYYSSYSGADADHNGVIDTAYTIGTNQTDNAPLAGPWETYFQGITAPASDFTANVTYGLAPLTVQFTDASTGHGITSYQWIFSDDPDQLFPEQDPVHTFMGPGSYEVRHSVTNAIGTGWSNVTDYIVVTNELPPAPVADFTGTPTSGEAPLTVRFTDESTNTPDSWAWTFGDGGTSTVQNATHTYTSAGTYTVNLTATNAGGSGSVEKTDYVTVSEPEVRTWTVGSSGCNFTVLNDALTNPSLHDGDTILVYNGSYTLSGTTSKVITVRGEGADLVTLNPSSATFTGAGTVFEGLKFSGGLITFNTANGAIRNCTFQAMTSGAILSGAGITFEHNTIRNNTINQPIDVSASNSLIVNNTFMYNGLLPTGTQTPLRLNTCTGVIVAWNDFRYNTGGIGLRSAGTGNRAYLNTFYGNNALVRSSGGTSQSLTWNSPAEMDYTYNGSPYHGLLGNYFSNYPTPTGTVTGSGTWRSISG